MALSGDYVPCVEQPPQSPGTRARQMLESARTRLGISVLYHEIRSQVLATARDSLENGHEMVARDADSLSLQWRILRYLEKRCGLRKPEKNSNTLGGPQG